jgi:acyl carrier protein
MVTPARSQNGPSREAVAAAVIGALARVVSRSIEEIHPESRLDEDLGLDSLAMIHASIAIEEALHVAVPASDAPEGAVVTVGDLIAFVEGRIDPAVIPW